MNPTELYDEAAPQFPANWPQHPEWAWVNVHDGSAPNLAAIFELLERCISSSEVIVLVHSKPGTATIMLKESAAAYVAQHVLVHEVQVADPLLTCFVSIGLSGVATSHA